MKLALAGRWNVNSAVAALCVLVFLLAGINTASGATYYVATNGNDVAAGTSWGTALLTITNGVAKAVAGDHVILSNGVYTVTNFVLINKGITVRGRTGNPADVSVNGNYPITSNRCFVLSHANAVLEDLTVTNGYGGTDPVFQDTWSFGGGVYFNVSGTMRNCLITGNSAAGRGGGVYLNQGGLITNCTLTGNVCPADGGAFFCYNGTVVDCLVSNNQGKCGGGGYVFGGMINTNDIVNNTGTSYGGGIVNLNGGVITNCLIQNNRVIVGKYHGGGGVYNRAGTVTRCRIIGNDGGTNSPGGGVTMRTAAGQFVLDCVIVSNVSARGGGIAFEAGSTGLVRNCLIAWNSTTNIGTWGGSWSGGINFNESPATVINCTIVENEGIAKTGGVGIHDSGSVINCLIYSNRMGGAQHNWANDGTMVMTYTNCFADPVAGLPGSGNIEGDPLFVDASAGDFRLLPPWSPCIDGGTNMSWMTNALDLDGYPRLDQYTAQADIGAYENENLPREKGMLFMIQ